MQDSKAFLVSFLRRVPYMLLIGLTGAILGSGLYLIIAAIENRTEVYVEETKYYLDFSDGRLEVRDYYNDFTWNDVLGTKLILDETMKTLGPAYDKETVKNMIKADILSDVRYLTITVRGNVKEEVEAVSAATKNSLEAFGTKMEEFDTIYQIEDSGIGIDKKPLFVWRAAFLGFLVAAGIGIFVWCVRFGIGEAFYTQNSITECFGIPVLGLLYAKGNQRDGIQEIQTCLALEETVKKKAVLMDVTEGDYAGHFLQAYQELVREEKAKSDKLKVVTYPIEMNKSYDDMKEQDGVILVIPFGVPCKEKVTDAVNELKRRKCPIIGAVLADADRNWVKAYYLGRKI